MKTTPKTASSTTPMPLVGVQPNVAANPTPTAPEPAHSKTPTVEITATPGSGGSTFWGIKYPDGYEIDCGHGQVGKARARHIVRCVNSHEQMRDLLARAKSSIRFSEYRAARSDGLSPKAAEDSADNSPMVLEITAALSGAGE